MKTLYKETKTGAIQQWSIWVTGSKITIQWGQKDGLLQIAIKKCSPKNVGRSNATTAEQQAKLEMASLIKKQQDKGYVSTIKAASTKSEKKILPMLAHEYKAPIGRNKSNMTFPCYVQPKLDGVRALFIDGKLISRKGKEYNVPHLVQQLQKLKLPNNIIPDGEIYVHGKSLQKINSLVKRNQTDSSLLEFHIYDVINTKDEKATFHKRLEILNKKIKINTNTPNLKLVETKLVNKEENLLMFDAIYREKGYEGTILRAIDLLYEINQRSRKLLKLKQFQDDEFEITGVKEGVGKFVGCAIFQCKIECYNPDTDDYDLIKHFDVVSPGTLEQKKEYFKNSKEYIGKLLRVKFFDYTEDSIPRFPVAVALMLDEDR